MIYNGLTKYLTDDSGGAIHVEGHRTVTYPRFMVNTNHGGGFWADIANMGGVLTLEHVIIQNNWTGNSTTDVSSGMGGGIYNDGDIFVPMSILPRITLVAILVRVTSVVGAESTTSAVFT